VNAMSAEYIGFIGKFAFARFLSLVYVAPPGD